MNPTLWIFLVSLLAIAPCGCEEKKTRGSGQVVATPSGVVIDQYVLDGNKLRVNQEEFGGGGEDPVAARSKRYISVKQAVSDNQPVKIRLRNRNGGLAVGVDRSLTEILVESVVSVAGDSSPAKNQHLADVKLVVNQSSDGWFDVESQWPAEGTPSEEECVINVTVPRLDMIDLQTTNGSIIAGSCSGGVIIRTENGDITADRPGGDIRLQSSNGTISLRLSLEWAGNLEAQAGNGRVNTETSLDARVETSSYQDGRAELEVGPPTSNPKSAELRTKNGSIEIRVG